VRHCALQVVLQCIVERVALHLASITMPRFVRDNGTKQTKEGSRARKPASKKLLVRGMFKNVCARNP